MKLIIEMLRVRTTGVRLTAGINGLPLAVDEDGRGLATRIPLNLWWMPSGNRVTVDVAGVPLEGPGARPRPKENPYFSIELMPPHEGAPPLGRVTWTHPDAGTVKPARIELPVASSTPCPTHLWDAAAKLDGLSDADRAGAIRAGVRLHEAFAKRKLDDVVNLLGWRFEDFARAFGEDPAEMKAGARKAYGELVNDPTWKPEAIAEKDVQATLFGTQLVKLERRGQPWIASAVGSSQMVTLPVFVAKLGGEWVVVR